MKNMLILGSEGFLGKAVQEYFRNNYNLICLDKDGVLNLNRNDQNSSLFFGHFDINNKDTYQSLIDFLNLNQLKIDNIVNLIGINSFKNFYDVSREDWTKTLDTNVTSFVFFLKELYPFFNTEVSIVAIASQNGVVAHENRIDYGTSKAALIHLVKNLTIDFLLDKEKDIKINCISPSYIQNESNKEFFNGFEGRKLLKKIPYRKLIEYSDVVNAIDFLISEKSKGIRGQNLIIDYGYTLI
ncbi:SDR family oxidoreductase [Bacillus toyonensis]|uniref:SDR family oxidoreductase n=1 Tax=Bacillus toyonensis TaxID=155322 RepID=UPI0003C33A52|nr:SDR family oxidoreductase [Bacillus toyonensis]KXY18106.1 short-chain dehydrogenase [Bacillus cereus]AHA10881.1 3-oxoacyl-[acyl-carrier protein] reductase [Bacillus toyonensis BCT-7112]KMP58735.1 short-chain dehydrogenase [Bacillus toyonensis]MCU4770359.1 SDR family oxidoreductase [Bacillus toyonensis]MCU5725449.1 SDR family oxidoreductase [Bacillus toyonensis]